LFNPNASGVGTRAVGVAVAVKQLSHDRVMDRCVSGRQSMKHVPAIWSRAIKRLAFGEGIVACAKIL
jgi:hypothetical protein